jgi:hypothetical protein
VPAKSGCTPQMPESLLGRQFPLRSPERCSLRMRSPDRLDRKADAAKLARPMAQTRADLHCHHDARRI